MKVNKYFNSNNNNQTINIKKQDKNIKYNFI